MVEAISCLRQSVVSATFLAQQGWLRLSIHFEIDFEPANSLDISQELEHLDFVHLCFLKHVFRDPGPILVHKRLL